MAADETVSVLEAENGVSLNRKYYRERSKVLDVRDQTTESRAIVKKNQICLTSVPSFRKTYSKIVFNVFHASVHFVPCKMRLTLGPKPIYG
jgi:hypothetical protein